MELAPENALAVYLWQMCDIHARDFVGMAGQVRPIRLEAVRAECDRTDDPEGNFQKVMLIEGVLFPARYVKKPRSWPRRTGLLLRFNNGNGIGGRSGLRFFRPLYRRVDLPD